jgi:hypothetical protein
MRRDIRGIWITETAGNLAEYDHDLRLCVLDRDHVSQTNVAAADLACCIVHEATHARLRSYGIGYKPESRARVERVCYRAEIAFAGRLPAGGARVDGAERALA